MTLQTYDYSIELEPGQGSFWVVCGSGERRGPFPKLSEAATDMAFAAREEMATRLALQTLQRVAIAPEKLSDALGLGQPR